MDRTAVPEGFTQHRQNGAGFTLVETLIVIAFFVVVMSGVIQLHITFGRVLTGQGSSIDTTLDGSAIMDALRSAGAQANRVIATHTFSGVVYNSGTTTAIFELPSIDASGSVIPNTFDYVGVYASSTEAYRIVDVASGSVRTSGKKLLANTLEELRLTYDDASFPLVTSLVAEATTSAAAWGQEVQTHLRARIYLRNL